MDLRAFRETLIIITAGNNLIYTQSNTVKPVGFRWKPAKVRSLCNMRECRLNGPTAHLVNGGGREAKKPASDQEASLRITGRDSLVSLCLMLKIPLSGD